MKSPAQVAPEFGTTCVRGILFHNAGIDILLSYQLAFFTPGISPADAISRNWILEMPN